MDRSWYLPSLAMRKAEEVGPSRRVVRVAGAMYARQRRLDQRFMRLHFRLRGFAGLVARMRGLSAAGEEEMAPVLTAE